MFPIYRAAVSVLGKRDLVRLRILSYGQIGLRSGDSDLDTIRQVIRDRAYSLRKSSCGSADRRVDDDYRRIIRARYKPVIVDAGANIGAASLWFANRYPEAVVDVRQRIDRHPASGVAALTPWLWNARFADQPLRSDLHRFRE